MLKIENLHASVEEKQVLMLADRNETISDELTYYASEKELLAAFIQQFKDWDPDVIIGWHVIGFDLMYLERKCSALGLSLDISRNGSRIQNLRFSHRCVDEKSRGQYDRQELLTPLGLSCFPTCEPSGTVCMELQLQDCNVGKENRW